MKKRKVEKTIVLTKDLYHYLINILPKIDSNFTNEFIEELKKRCNRIKDVYNKDMSYTINDDKYTLEDLEIDFHECSIGVTNDNQKKELEYIYDIIENKKVQMKAINDILNRIKTVIPDSNNENKEHMLVIHFASVTGLITAENEVEKDLIEKIDESIEDFKYKLRGNTLHLEATTVNGEEKQSTFNLGTEGAKELLFKIIANKSF